MLGRFRERIRGWRTIAFHGAVSVLSGLLLSVDLLRGFDWTQVVSPATALWVGVGLGLAGIWLRVITTGPVGERHEHEEPEHG